MRVSGKTCMNCGHDADTHFKRMKTTKHSPCHLTIFNKRRGNKFKDCPCFGYNSKPTDYMTKKQLKELDCYDGAVKGVVGGKK